MDDDGNQSTSAWPPSSTARPERRGWTGSGGLEIGIYGQEAETESPPQESKAFVSAAVWIVGTILILFVILLLSIFIWWLLWLRPRRNQIQMTPEERSAFVANMMQQQAHHKKHHAELGSDSASSDQPGGGVLSKKMQKSTKSGSDSLASFNLQVRPDAIREKQRLDKEMKNVIKSEGSIVSDNKSVERSEPREKSGSMKRHEGSGGRGGGPAGGPAAGYP